MAQKKKYLVINFKTYDESTGKDGLKLAKTIEALARKKKGVLTILVPTALGLSEIAKGVKSAKVFGQHAEPIEPGKHTGWLAPADFRKSGAAGILINHAEHQIPHDKIAKTIQMARNNGLMTIVCAKDDVEAGQIAALGPDVVSIEPPELIGSGISVSTARPEIVSNGIEAVRNVADLPVLCGAGISSGADVKKALELGADGVLLASFITLAKDKKKAVKDILSGF
jgi:triosephosphate isomerase (TIM)